MPGSLVVSADSHIFEPPELWESRIDKKYRDRAPKAVLNHLGEEGTFWVVDGIAPRRIANIAALNMKPDELPNFNKASYADLRPGGWDPAERLKDQDIDGVSAEVIYATYTMYLFAIEDTGLQQACFRAYNDWLAEYCSHSPKRLIGLGMVCLDEIDEAVAELKRCAKMGLRGVMITVVPRKGQELSDASMEPFWAAAAELGMPVSLHALTNSRKTEPRFDYAKFSMGMYITLTHDVQLALADVLCHGILERYPILRLVVAEADTGWIPHFLERLDRGYTRFEHLNDLHLEMMPSEYFHRQVNATFIKDRVGVVTREFIGVDNLMWSSDYPHTDSTWPHSQKSIDHDLAGIADEERRKLLFHNVVKLYDLGLE